MWNDSLEIGLMVVPLIVGCIAIQSSNADLKNKDL